MFSGLIGIKQKNGASALVFWPADSFANFPIRRKIRYLQGERIWRVLSTAGTHNLLE